MNKEEELLNRIFVEESAKLAKVKKELTQKEVTVEDFGIALSEKHNEMKEAMTQAVGDGDKNKIIEDAQFFCSETRKKIGLITSEHLEKPYK